MKVSKEKFTAGEIECISKIMAGEKAPIEHPAYPTFQQKYQEFCSADENHIKAIWNELIKGYQIQLDKANFALEKSTNREYLNTVNDNEHFRKAVDVIQKDGGLAVPQDKELALWSGGYALSVAIRDMGFYTLERTPFGNILDNLWVTWEWKREGGLWNILSAAFVGGYEPGRRAHIYFRTVDEMSVLYEQELPMLMKDEERVIVMHPVYQQGTQMSEVGYDFKEKIEMAINPDAGNCVFAYQAGVLKNNMKNKEFLPYKALENKLGVQGYSANMQVYLNYRSDKFIPGHAPFARDEEQTSGYDSQKEEREKFWGKGNSSV